MADPLSLTASIVAILGVAASTIEGLQKAKDIYNAPQHVDVIVEELSDIRSILHDINEVSTDTLSAFSTDALLRLLPRAQTKISAIDSAIQVVIRPNDTSGDGLKISRKRWLRDKSNIEKLRSELRDIRWGLTAAVSVQLWKLTATVAADVKSLGLVASNVVGQTSRLHELATTQKSEVFAIVKCLMQQPVPPYSRNEFFSHSKHSQESLHGQEPHGEDSFWTKADQDLVNHPLRSISYHCCCHETSQLSSPWPMSGIFGHLTLTYSTSLFSPDTCNNVWCRKQPRTILDLFYRFPPWLLMRCISFSSLIGPEPVLRFPAVIRPDSRLFYYASSGNEDGIRSLVSAKENSPLDISGHVRGGHNALQVALLFGQTSTCKLLLDMGADPYHVDDYGRNAFDIALLHIITGQHSKEYRREMRLLFGNASTLKQMQFTSLHRATCGLSNSSVSSVLTSSPELLNVRDKSGLTPLGWAFQRTDVVNLEALLSAGADVNYNHCEILYDLPHTDSIEEVILCIEHLLKAGAEVKSKDKSVYDNTPLHFLVTSFDSVHLVKLYHAYGADINAVATDSRTPLLGALTVGHFDAALELLRLGAAVDTSLRTDGLTPLHMAAWRGAPSALASALLGAGADPYVLNHHNETALDVAIRFANIDFMLELLRWGVRDNRPFKQCGLCFAVAQNQADVVSAVLDHGIEAISGDPATRNEPLRELLEYAIGSNLDRSLTAILEYHEKIGSAASFHSPNARGRTVYHFLAADAEVGTIETFRANADLRGSSTNVEDCQGYTALHLLKLRSDYTHYLQEAFDGLLLAASEANKSGENDADHDHDDDGVVYEDAVEFHRIED